MNSEFFLFVAGALLAACATNSPTATAPTRVSESSDWEEPPPARETPIGVGARAVRPTRLPWGQWRTVRTGHFILHTDLPESKAARLLDELERRYGGLAGWFGVEEQAGRLEAVVFANEAEYVERFGRSVGVYTGGRGGERGDVVVSYETRPANLGEENLTQAIVRQFINEQYPRLPGWLRDGLVNYLGTATLSEGRLYFGGPPLSLGLQKEVGSVALLSDLFGADDPNRAEVPSRVRNTSGWALIGYLLDRSTFGDAAVARLQAWLGLVNRGGPSAEAIAQAFADIYPERTMADVDAVLGGRARAAAGTRVYPQSVPAAELATVPLEIGPPDPRLAGLLSETQEKVEVARWNPVRAAEGRRSRAIGKRHLVRVDGSVSAPTDLVGAAYSFLFAPQHAFDLELGWSPFGYFVSPRYRPQLGLGGGNTVLLSFGIGPFYALKNKTRACGPKCSIMRPDL